MSRRQFLRRGGVGLGASVAGCTTQNEASDDNHDHDHNHDETDSAETGSENEIDSALQLNGTALSDAFPIELVEPDVEPFEGYAAPEQRVANVHWHGEEISHWHFQPVEVTANGTRQLRTRFVDQSDQEIPIGPSEAYFQSVHTTEETAENLVSIAVDEAHVTLSGKTTGTGRVVFRLHDSNDETVLWTSPELEVRING
jgi:hypothetical protein